VTAKIESRAASTAPRSRRVHQTTPENERAILDAVLSLAVTAGYEGTTMAEVARVSGLPIGSVYWHFENKERLFAALIDYCFEAWKERHRGPTNRHILHESIAGSAAHSTNTEHVEEAFWIIGLLFALEKRLGDNAARQKYLAVRGEMYELLVETVGADLPPAALAAEPNLARKIVMLGRALTDGFYISASAGDDIDFVEAAELSALAIEKLVQHYEEIGARATLR
jgi:AcrR family transcriptional regulator